MRAAVCAILLLLTIFQDEALECNYCTSKGADLCTPTSTQSCSKFGTCGAIILRYPLYRSFRRCMDKRVCHVFAKASVNARCCNTDLCN